MFGLHYACSIASISYHNNNLETEGVLPEMLSLYASHDIQVEGRNIDKCKWR